MKVATLCPSAPVATYTNAPKIPCLLNICAISETSKLVAPRLTRRNARDLPALAETQYNHVHGQQRPHTPATSRPHCGHLP